MVQQRPVAGSGPPSEERGLALTVQQLYSYIARQVHPPLGKFTLRGSIFATMTLLGASEAQAAWLALALTGVALLLVSVADQQPARRREAEPVFKLTSDDSSSSGPLLPAAAALTPLEDSGKELVWVCGGNVPVNWQKHDVCADLAGCNASTTGSPCDGGPQTPFCNVEPAGSQPAGGASTTWQSYIRATPDLELGQWAGLDVEGNFLLNAATAGANASAAAAGSARLEASCGAAYGRLTQSLGPGGFGLRSRCGESHPHTEAPVLEEPATLDE